MNVIEKYQFGRITINGFTYHSDIIIFPEHLHENWWREQGHFLQISDLQSIIDYQPDALFIGTGMYGLMRVEEQLIQALKEKGTKKIIVEKTKKACEEFNRETAIKKVAALHLTC